MKRAQQGFTLLEIIIYLGLFAIIIGGALITAYQIIQSTQQAQAQAMVQEEANFILSKINWSLTGLQTITTSASGDTLSVTKVNFAQNPIAFRLTGSTMEMSRANSTYVPLSSDNVVVSNLSFQHITVSGQPEAVHASFNLRLNNQSGDGLLFETTKYIRK